MPPFLCARPDGQGLVLTTVSSRTHFVRDGSGTDCGDRPQGHDADKVKAGREPFDEDGAASSRVSQSRTPHSEVF